MKVGALLPTRLPMRIPRGLVTAGAFDICTRAILSETFAISHFLILECGRARARASCLSGVVGLSAPTWTT